MMNNSSFNISSMSKMFVGAAVISAVTYASFALISDGDISSDDINAIFDEALQENAETVIELCEENLNETTVAQGLQIISGLNITVDNNLVATVKKRCDELLNSTTSTLTSTTIPVETTILVETTTTIPSTECDESLSKVVAEDPSQVRVSIIQDAIYAEYYDDGESYIEEGILICWEPFLVDGFESEDYWVVFGWTLDDYISADGSSYDTGIIYSVSSRYGPNGNAENPPTNIFFEYEYFYDFDEAKPYIENGKLKIYFQIEALNESSPNYWSEKTQPVSVTIDVP
jgi:hypothetical protein